MIMKVCMHKVLLNRFRATYPKHCYMIIDSSHMTEKMLIVILSTNAPSKRMKFKAITEKKKQYKKFYFFFIWQGSNLCDDRFCALFFAISLTL